MYDRTEQILEGDAIDFTGNMKGRGFSICTDAQGSYRLMEYSGSVHRLELLEQLLAHLDRHGIICEQMVRTKEKELVKQGKVSDYYLRSYFYGEECDTRNKEAVIKCVRLLARLHIALEQWELAEDELQEAPDYIVTIDKRMREMRKVKNYARSRKQRNDFERAYLTFYEEAISQALQAKEFLQDSGDASVKDQICHGDYNQHNLLFTSQGIAIVGFEKFRRETVVYDLANFLRKILEKHNWNGGLGMDLVMAYNAIRPLERAELLQLYARLLFPEKFWKITNRFYNAKKSQGVGVYGTKLEKLFVQEKKRQEFLSMLFYLIK